MCSQTVATAVLVGFSLLPVVATRSIACTGDCNADGVITINELVQGVATALGEAALANCDAIDSDGDGSASVAELIAAVGYALAACPAATPTVPPPTASQTATASLTVTASATAPPSASSTGDIATATATAVPTTPADRGTRTATPTEAPRAPFCDIPGSVRSTGAGIEVIPGGPADAPDLSFLKLPIGFCAHFYANVGNTRQLRFAPGGELFVASPTTLTTGGNDAAGLASIVVLPDDDRDGSADATVPFLSGLPATQGMLFADGWFYYQDGTAIRRLPYAAGDRAPAGASEEVLNVTVYSSRLHWPKLIDQADNGTIYVTNGGDQNERCDASRPFRGGILRIDGTPGGAQVAKGFRSAISIRCLRGTNRCYAIELARDYSNAVGGREKLVRVHEGDDFGHPCCATANLPYPEIQPPPDCSEVDEEGAAFVIGHTPFDLDFETGKWPSPWDYRVYVPMHGVFGSWAGARLVTVGFDPIPGVLIHASELPGTDPGSFAEFAEGWDDGTRAHGRPANIAFAPDGRLFLGNDVNGDIIWIAPLELQ